MILVVNDLKCGINSRIKLLLTTTKKVIVYICKDQFI
jgi:hypothetical protein